MPEQHPTTTPATDVDPPGLRREKLVPWLLEHVAGLHAPLTFTRIGDGQSNLTFRVSNATGRAVVLRRPPLGEILASAHDMEREHRVLSALATVDAPTPTPLAIGRDPELTGAPFYVMEHVDGEILTTVADAERLSVVARDRAPRALAETLVRLQAIDLDAVGLGYFRRSASYRDRQLRRWHRQWEASRTRDLPLVDALAERFATGLPDGDGEVLVHGDYRLDNAVLAPDGEVRTVLDWELCTAGDALADVGLMIAYWNEQGAVAGTPEGLFREPVTAVAGFPGPDALVEAYAAASGRDVEAVDRWVAFAYWKIAIIVEGVYRRWLNDPSNGSGAGALGGAVDRLVQQADEAARKAGI